MKKGHVLIVLAWFGVSAMVGSEAHAGRIVVRNSLGMKLMGIRPGTFTMGQEQGGDWDERPVHRVTVSQTFYMSVTEVTNAQYEMFDPSHRAERGRAGLSQEDDEAVIFVTWHEATAFCQWLSKKEGETCRLPTEAEWEYACRAGTVTPYHTGDTLPEAYHKNQKEVWSPSPVSLIVAKTPPNAWGLHDMHGNVEEWCSDWYGPYPPQAQTDPAGYASGDFKVSRGGSHGTQIAYLRSANRMGTLPHDKSCFIGFRIVRGEMPETSELLPGPPPRNRRDIIQQTPPEQNKAVDTNAPHFKGPIEYVKIPPGSEGPLYSHHNHDPALVDCPNGDLLAIWYSCLREQGRELAVVASRLRAGAEAWEPASPFWDAPDRNDHAPALYFDGRHTLYHFNGLSAGATWGMLATIVRTSADSGATWSKARLINPEHGLRHMPIESVFRSQEGVLVLPCDAVTGGRGGTAIHLSRDEGHTWSDPGAGRPKPTFEEGATGAWIAGIHAGVVQLKDGRLMALGRGDNIEGRMPMSLSKDMGQNWTYAASEFPPIGGGQRLILRRLREGPILLISFAPRAQGMLLRYRSGTERRIHGMFAALSYDEGKTWPWRRLATAGGPGRQLDGGGNTGSFTMDIDHAEPKGYLAATQTPDGVIHLITSKLYYRFNSAWLRDEGPVMGSVCP